MIVLCLVIWMMHCVGYAKVVHWENSPDKPYDKWQLYFHVPLCYTWGTLVELFDLFYGSIWCCLDDKKAEEVGKSR